MFKLVILVAVIYVCCAFHLGVSSPHQKHVKMNMKSDNRVPFIAGNWKQNPVSLSVASLLAEDVVRLTKESIGVNVALFPPAPFLTTIAAKIDGSHIKLGGQHCHFESSGAYTGEHSATMLKECGAEYVLCGHSERRSLFGDDDEVVNLKLKQALKEGMKVILCIGETAEQYEDEETREVCAEQLTVGLEGVSGVNMDRVVIAYEPVWAIGTGKVCPPNEAQKVHHFIRAQIAGKYGSEIAKACIIQYGGSVKADNICDLLSQPDVDGALVGGAALSAESFASIVNQANSLHNRKKN